MSKPNKKEIATRALAEALGIPYRQQPKLTDAQQLVRDHIAGTSRPTPGTAAAELDAALQSQADAHRHTGAHESSIERKPSDDMRQVITDVLRGMHARGELK